MADSVRKLTDEVADFTLYMIPRSYLATNS